MSSNLTICSDNHMEIVYDGNYQTCPLCEAAEISKEKEKEIWALQRQKEALEEKVEDLSVRDR